uniref:Mitochondrial import receptor subunit TOM22 homolog n=1 Tax=Trichuris muris TaxID=70415 RepID=A0A5S6QJ58_TRIMR
MAPQNGDNGLNNSNSAEDVDDLDETFTERLMGLTEMFPDKLREVVRRCGSAVWNSSTNLFSLARSAAWFVVTTSTIMLLPVIIEKERVDFEQMHLMQQKQILFGPSAALAASGRPR